MPNSTLRGWNGWKWFLVWSVVTTTASCGLKPCLLASLRKTLRNSVGVDAERLAVKRACGRGRQAGGRALGPAQDIPDWSHKRCYLYVPVYGTWCIYCVLLYNSRLDPALLIPILTWPTTQRRQATTKWAKMVSKMWMFSMASRIADRGRPIPIKPDKFNFLIGQYR